MPKELDMILSCFQNVYYKIVKNNFDDSFNLVYFIQKNKSVREFFEHLLF